MTAPTTPDRDTLEGSDWYRNALARYNAAALKAVVHYSGLRTRLALPDRLARAIEEHLRDATRREAVLAGLGRLEREAARLLPLFPPNGWRLVQLRDLLCCFGYHHPERVIWTWVSRGLVSVRTPRSDSLASHLVNHGLDSWVSNEVRILPHPAFGQQMSGPVCDPPKDGVVRAVREVRESDGWELIVRAAVLWQRALHARLRVTQDGKLFKREQERLDEDAVLTAPLSDSAGTIPNLTHAMLEAVLYLGLLERDPDADELRARRSAFWQLPREHAIQLMTRAWLQLRAWDEVTGSVDAETMLWHNPNRRWMTMLVLAALEPEAWVELDELAREIAERDPHRAHFKPAEPVPPAEANGHVAAFLQGSMYQLGVVRLARSVETGRTAVQVTPLGRWIFGVAEPPAPSPAFEKVLFVQPNLEIIVYRTGVTTELLGQLASFCEWRGLGAALRLELSANAAYHGLELGRTAEEILGILNRHSQRPVPAVVTESLRTWAQRRERLSLYVRAAVLEFATPEDLAAALERGVPGTRLADRLLLVADERLIPFDQFRLSGSKDYRLPSVPCVDVESDGVTLRIDPAKADLLVERELTRFAEPLDVEAGTPLRYRCTPQSLGAAARRGLNPAHLQEWFVQRVRTPITPSILLMLQAFAPTPLEAARAIVIETPSEVLADGLQQHPATRPYVAARLGPTTLTVLPEKLDALRAALQEMGIELHVTPASNNPMASK